MRRAHGQLRGLDSIDRSSTSTGRFGRMFRWLPAAFPVFTGQDMAAYGVGMAELAKSMIQGEFEERRQQGEKLDSDITESEPEDENPTITAGYTYLGQFIDHDITFDPASSLDKLNDPDALEDFRTPRLDLDSVYGRGPDDQPYLYGNGGTPDNIFLQNGDDKKPPSVAAPRPDHLRSPQGIALIGDPRNDENLLVLQIHQLFIQFHNAVVRQQNLPGLSAAARFAEAQRTVRWHYQWIVLHDFLPKIVGSAMTEAVLGNPSDPVWRGPNLKFYRPKSGAYMPVEFSVAAYRLGHSMIRPSYSLSETVHQSTDPEFNRIPIFSAKQGPLDNLNGFRALPDFWGIDWGFFFEGTGTVPPAGFQVPQPSYRMDTHLVDPLAALPGFTNVPSLAERNLKRALAMQLPSGQDVALAMGVSPMDDATLWEGREGVLAQFPFFQNRAPLWFYILREAELTTRDGVNDPAGGGHHLGAVGGRIVAEVLIGLIWNDHHSQLYQAPHWQPSLPIAPHLGVFGIADLIRFVDANPA